MYSICQTDEHVHHEHMIQQQKYKICKERSIPKGFFKTSAKINKIIVNVELLGEDSIKEMYSLGLGLA